MRNFTALSSLLRSLCDNAPWSYAVFWKINHESNMILTCEDGYFYDGKASIKVEGKQYGEPAHVEPAIKPIHCIHDDKDGTLANFPIKLALESMSSHVYLMGDGIVGKAALEKRHYWIFTGDDNYKFLFMHYGDWQLQLDTGIKTILIVPVMNYGVVQLGSLNLVVEDFKVVVHLRSLFSNLYHESQICSSLNSFVDCSSTFSPLYTPSMEKRSTVSAELLIPPNSKHFLSVESDLFSVMDGCDLQSSQNATNDQMLDFGVSRYADETGLNVMYNNQLLAPSEGPFLLNNPSNVFGGNMSKLVIIGNGIENNIQNIIGGKPNTKQFDSFLENQDGWCSLYASEAALFQEVEREYNDSKTYDGLLVQEDGETSNFAVDLESHNALGSIITGEPNSYLLDTTVPKAGIIVDSTLSIPTKSFEVNGFSTGENHTDYLKEGDGDSLLDAVVNSFCCRSCDTLDNASERLSSYSSEKLMQSCQTQNTNESSVFEFGNLPSASQKSSVSDAEGITNPLATSLRSINRLASEDQNCTTDVPRYIKPDSKKPRGKNGDKQKPRPRDRQLIQDRVKELRGLIPNGSNCSIDALLEKTVRHMLFLRGISAQAEKSRQSKDRKVKGEVFDSMKPGNYPNGASWAYEVGSNPANFPLIIENLDQPGQILVEMMCKDYGLFLEIARVIRHLDLMILKGVLESRSDKLWAHFVIEVSKDFQRTQILWPLMQLVQQNEKFG